MANFYDNLWKTLDAKVGEFIKESDNLDEAGKAKYGGYCRGIAEGIVLWGNQSISTVSGFPDVDSVVRHSFERVKAGVTTPVHASVVNTGPAAAAAPTQTAPVTAAPAPSGLSDAEKAAISNALAAGLSAEQLAETFKCAVGDIEMLAS